MKSHLVNEQKNIVFLRCFLDYLSYGAIILLVVLSILSPVLASIYLLSIILAAFVKAIAISYRVISGYSNMEKASRVDWNGRLSDLEDPKEAYSRLRDNQSKDCYINNM